MRAVAEGATLAGGVRVLAVLLAAYLVLGQPAVGWWSARRQHRAGDRDARRRRYRRTMILEWSLTAAAVLLALAGPGLDLGDLGLRWPRGSAYTLVGAVGFVVSLGLLMLLRRRVDQGAGVVAPAEVTALLPRTAKERRSFAQLALTAGICEELLYRGFLLAVVAAFAPELGPWRLVLVSALAFAVAHTYQGVTGMLTAGVLGAGFAILFLGSGSLLLPVLYHVLIDLRLLLLAVRTPRHRAAGRAEGRAAGRAEGRTAGRAPGPTPGVAPTFSPRRPPGARADSPRGPA
ncbi:MAG TPA: type II CAAX endopeptidase family protein [Mycobacteriales bacterium]|nr:type II CAAX endopeptidase family protein [Mycobacteriales bacterium]